MKIFEDSVIEKIAHGAGKVNRIVTGRELRQKVSSSYNAGKAGYSNSDKNFKQKFMKKLNQFEQLLNDSNDEFEELMENYRQDKVKHLSNKGNNINLGAKIDVKVGKYQKNIDWHPSKGVKKLQNDINKIISENQIPKSEGLLNNISQSQ